MPSDSRPPVVAPTTSRATRAHAPTSRPERRHRRARRASASSRPSGEERAEVGRLHGARTAARGHGQVVAERVAEARRGGVRRAAALERVTAHHADQVDVRPPTPPGPRRRGGRAGPSPGRPRVWCRAATRRRPARRGCRGSAGCRRGRRGSRAWTGRGRPGCRGSRAARRHRHDVRRRRRRRRSRSRGTAPRRATARAARPPRSVQVEPDDAASPASERAPAASRRSRSARVVTSTTRPWECFTRPT